MTERPTAPSQRSGVGGILATYLERPTGGQTGSVGRAASATKAFLAFSLVLTGAYTIFFAMYDASAFAANIISGTVSVILFGVGLGFVTRGHQLTAAVIAVSVGTAQVAFTTTYVGWIAGFQLYLIAGGQLVFMLFTDRQQMLRAAYVAVAIGAFFYCQLIVPEKGAGRELLREGQGRHVLHQRQRRAPARVPPCGCRPRRSGSRSRSG
ncbi:MAG: hypothetical protein NVV57_08005 [Demequina sp.]|nr:hypothetical protein [Demequina sp.]